MSVLVCICFLSLLGSCAASYSPHPAVTKVSKQTPEYSSRVAVHWYFPEFGYGDYANTTRVYTCRYTDPPQEFVYEYELVLTLRPEFAKIYYSAEIGNMPEGNVCFQICAIGDETLERCSEPFKFENKLNIQTPLKSFPVFWDQNKHFKTYPYILKLEPRDSSIDIEWYFPQHQTKRFPKTFVYSCEFSPEDLSFSNRELVREIDTQESSIHRARIPNTPTRWACALVCAVSHYLLCAEPAKFDNYLFLSGLDSTPQSIAAPSSAVPADITDVSAAKDNTDSYDLVFDDYEEYDSYFEQSQPGMISLKKDRIETGNFTSSEVSCSPLLSSRLFVLVLSLSMLYLFIN